MLNSRQKSDQRGSGGKPPGTNRGVTGAAGRLPCSAKNVNAIGTGIDWLTCTTDKDEIGGAWYSYVVGTAGGDVEPWRNRWYNGVKADNLRWGYRERQGYIFISTGDTVASVWRFVVPAAKSVSRVDLQVTVELEEPVVQLAQEYYLSLPGDGRRNYTLMQNKKGGSTLYVGSRKSPGYGRLYDKGVESGAREPGSLWRYEVENKHPRSTPLAMALLSKTANEKDDVGTYNSLASAIIPHVWDWFDGKGVRPLFSQNGDDELVIEIGRKVTTDEKRLEWLRTQVAPTVSYFIKKNALSELVDALGLRGIDIGT